MKKKILMTSIAFVVAALVAFNISIIFEKENNYNLLLENIEAKARGETSNGSYLPTDIYCKITEGDDVWWETGVACPDGNESCTPVKCPSDPY